MKGGSKEVPAGAWWANARVVAGAVARTRPNNVLLNIVVGVVKTGWRSTLSDQLLCDFSVWSISNFSKKVRRLWLRYIECNDGLVTDRQRGSNEARTRPPTAKDPFQHCFEIDDTTTEL
jgi:hypothetical protein